MLITFSLFLFFIVSKVPIAYSLFAASIYYMLAHHVPLEMAVQRLAIGVDSFPLIAVPFFILAGAIMNTGGITRKIFSFADHLVGHLTGGLGHANILASVIFSGMSGAAIADAGGLGAIELNAMKEAGYDEDFSLAITGASSIIGPIIPPSIPAVIFAVTGGVSTGKLFAAGILPGLCMAVVMAVMVYCACRKANYAKRQRARFREIYLSFRDSVLALLSPVIILGGIITGIFTPTEAAIIAVFYSIAIGFYYRTLKWKDIPPVLREALDITVSVFFIVAAASLFGLVLTISQVPQTLAASFIQLFPNKYVALLMLNIFLLIVGCFMEPTAAIMILVPILLPVITALKIDPIHFGIIMILNLMIGLLTPPVGMVLYVLSSVSDVPFERIARVSFPYVVAMTGLLLVFTYVPGIVLIVPNWLFPK
jgi:tripartite ATP-independent transporter DctM subunit